MKKLLYVLLFVFPLLHHGTTLKQPKFILLVVIDQLRGDLIDLHRQQFGENGFNYLLQHGIDFHNTHHPHANTSTCPGHATIATGSYPALHGVVDNNWYHRSTGRFMYCMEDEQSPILATSHTKTLPAGRSPANLMASTLADELLLAKAGRAYAVSLKDRAAISLAGHAGKAFWFDKENGGFVTSRWYYEKYPWWVNEWNRQYEPEAVTWNLGQTKTFYLFADAPRFKNRFQSFGEHFPHFTGEPSSKHYFKFLSMTPIADKLTADFAEHLIIEEKLGQKQGKTDYLGVSFSANDAIGHQFGPNSLEAEDNILKLDKTLGHLLTVIDKHVGLDNTLIVLTADHGVSDTPTYLKNHQIKEINPIPAAALKQTIQQHLKTRFNLPESALLKIAPPFIYLNKPFLQQQQIDIQEVSHYLAGQLNGFPGIYKAYSLPVTADNRDWISEKVNRMAYPERSGDIYLVTLPYQSYDKKSERRVAHGSPWKYDSFVPLLFVSPAFKAQTIHKAVSTTDIAPTLAEILRIKSPSASVGQPLDNVLVYFDD